MKTVNDGMHKSVRCEVDLLKNSNAQMIFQRTRFLTLSVSRIHNINKWTISLSERCFQADNTELRVIGQLVEKRQNGSELFAALVCQDSREDVTVELCFLAMHLDEANSVIASCYLTHEYANLLVKLNLLAVSVLHIRRVSLHKPLQNR